MHLREKDFNVFNTRSGLGWVSARPPSPSICHSLRAYGNLEDWDYMGRGQEKRQGRVRAQGEFWGRPGKKNREMRGFQKVQSVSSGFIYITQSSATGTEAGAQVQR